MKLKIAKAGFFVLSVLLVPMSAAVGAEKYLNTPKELVIKLRFTKEAISCIECHARKMPGTVEYWKEGRMSHAKLAGGAVTIPQTSLLLYVVFETEKGLRSMYCAKHNRIKHCD